MRSQQPISQTYPRKRTCEHWQATVVLQNQYLLLFDMTDRTVSTKRCADESGLRRLFSPSYTPHDFFDFLIFFERSDARTPISETAVYERERPALQRSFIRGAGGRKNFLTYLLF